jgi:hypothetical protein
VTLRLKAIFAEEELSQQASCKDCLQVRSEGDRDVSHSLRHYRLEAILAVDYRVRSRHGTQFRQWATARMSEYLVKRFGESAGLSPVSYIRISLVGFLTTAFCAPSGN